MYYVTRAPHRKQSLVSSVIAHCAVRFPSSAMAATQKLYPRGTVKRIVKAHSNRSVSKNADILVRPISLPARNPYIANAGVDWP